MKVCFETFGCRLNKAEALQMEAEYLAKGWKLTEEHSDADLFIIRGCSVTARAQRECEELIDHLRRYYPRVPLRICGCLKDEKDARGGIFGQSPSEGIPRIRGGAPRGGALSKNSEALALPTRTARAYLKVQDGCSGKCTFCIVPQFRGPSVSTPFPELIDHAKRFIEAGYHEIVVTGCNLSLYASEGKRLPDLLAALAELSPDCRIRLGSLEPGACALETVHAMAEHANICRFLHLPVQSGSNRILLAMKRPYQVKDVESLVMTACKLMPSLGLGCDLMTGFPDETEMDFLLSQSLLKRLPFTNAHVFPYSERPGTLAVALNGSVPKNIRSVRAHELSRIIREARKRFLRTFIGKTVEIISENDKQTAGWTGEYLACEAIGCAPRKARVNVFVTGVKDDCLMGRVVKST